MQKDNMKLQKDNAYIFPHFKGIATLCREQLI
jgi:hypothetical protein